MREPAGRLGSLTLGGWLVAGLLLTMTAAGAATAGALVTGAQIKDGTVTTKDVKNRSLKLDDIKPGEVAKLHGHDGAAGAAGAAGASAFAPPPSGTVVVGGGILRTYVPGADNPEVYSPLPFVPPVPLNDEPVGRNMFLAPSSFALDSNEDPSCAGTNNAPAPPPGVLCVYFFSGTLNVASNTARIYSGNGPSTDASDSHGFNLSVGTTGAGTVQLRYVWAYRAP